MILAEKHETIGLLEQLQNDLQLTIDWNRPDLAWEIFQQDFTKVRVRVTCLVFLWKQKLTLVVKWFVCLYRTLQGIDSAVFPQSSAGIKIIWGKIIVIGTVTQTPLSNDPLIAQKMP